MSTFEVPSDAVEVAREAIKHTAYAPVPDEDYPRRLVSDALKAGLPAILREVRRRLLQEDVVALARAAFFEAGSLLPARPDGITGALRAAADAVLGEE